MTFDTINFDHGTLLECLSDLVVVDTGVCTFLLNRSQMLVLGDHSSSHWPAAYGMLQGSVMSPVLLNIYMDKVLRHFRLWCHHYAGDMQLYLTLPSDPKVTLETLLWCLEEVKGWMRANKLNFNSDMMEVSCLWNF